MARARVCLALISALMVAGPVAALTVIAEPVALRPVPSVAPEAADEAQGLSAAETMVMLLGSVVFSAVLLGRKLD